MLNVTEVFSEAILLPMFVYGDIHLPAMSVAETFEGVSTYFCLFMYLFLSHCFTVLKA